MSDYSIALFFHLVGALSLFMALALEWVGLRALWRASRSNALVSGWAPPRRPLA
jgi:hypothetical protein